MYAGIHYLMSLLKRLICIIEDDCEIQSTLQEILELEGYQVRAAKNGREALELINHEGLPADLILLDLMMPVMTGQDFLRAAEQILRKKSIPVVVMSAGTNMQTPAPDLVKERLKKPLNVDRLLDTISKYCKKGRAAA